MKQNVGPVDRVLRVILGVVLVYAALTVSGLWAWVAGGAAAIMFVTALVGFCPLYALFGINTCPMRAQTQR